MTQNKITTSSCNGEKQYEAKLDRQLYQTTFDHDTFVISLLSSSLIIVVSVVIIPTEVTIRHKIRPRVRRPSAFQRWCSFFKSCILLLWLILRRRVQSFGIITLLAYSCFKDLMPEDHVETRNSDVPATRTGRLHMLQEKCCALSDLMLVETNASLQPHPSL